MKIRIADFKGEIPRRADRLLPDNVATISYNARLNDGNVTAFRESTLEHTFPGAVEAFYRHNGTWLSFFETANVAPGPVAQDRLYYTTIANPPRVIIDTTDYPLAVATPATAPTVARVGTLIADLAETILFSYTFVTEFDEESVPSPTSAPLLWSPGTTVSLSAMQAAPAGRGIDRRRIYRSQTSASGVTDLYFVAEIAVANTTYSHDIDAAPLQEVLPSANYDPPIATLDGLTPMANGMMAAFSGRKVYFCEPFLPHAWPDKYSLTVDYDIVALCAFGSTLAILTAGTPYIAQGTAPETMVMNRMETNLPCVSRLAVVDLGYAAAYPSTDGLIVITASGAQMVSRNLFTRDDWRALAPETFIAANYDGRYAFGYKDSELTMVDGGDAAMTVPRDFTFEGGAPSTPILGYVNYDGGNPLTKSAVNAIGFIDLTGEQPHFLRTDPSESGSPESFFLEPATNNLFFLVNFDEVRRYDTRTAAETSYTWRSKIFYSPSPLSFTAILVETNSTEAGAQLATRVYADGKLVRETTRFNRAERLPGGFLATSWQVEIAGDAEVTSISIGQTLEEMGTG